MCNFNFSLKETYYSLSIKYQVFIGVLGIILMTLFSLTLIITLILFLLNISAYKDVVNFLDNQEFDQLALFGIAAEHSSIYYSDFFKSYSSELSNFRYYLGKIGNLGIINSSYLNKTYPDFLGYQDFNQNNLNSNKSMSFYSSKHHIDELNNDTDFQQQLDIINSMILMITFSQKFYLFSFDNTATKFPFYQKIIMVDYKREVIFWYPNDGLGINADINTNDLLDYVQTEYTSMNTFINYINKYVPQQNFQNYSNFNKSIEYLPLYLEKNIYPNFFNTTNDLHAFSANNHFRTRLNITVDNYIDKIDSNVFVLSNNSISDLVYDTAANQIGLINIINTDYKYPYDLYTLYQCQHFYYKGNDYNIAKIKNFTILSDCFNGKSNESFNDVPTNNFSSDYEKFTKNFGLFYNSSDFPMSYNNQSLVNHHEENMLVDYLNLLTTGNSLRLMIYNERYKLRKSYFPLTSYRTFNYYYPITSIQLSFVLKNEAYFDFIQHDFFLHSIANFIISLAGFCLIGYFILGIVVYFLIKVMKLIDKPLNIIDDALKTISDLDKFTKAKIDLENYIYEQKYYAVIDEFIELITIILEMIEGNMNLKHETSHNEIMKIKMSKDEVNKEIAMIKLNNLIVMENVIMEKLENDNFFYEILKISLENQILQDKNVKSCECFVSLVDSHMNKAKRSKLEQIRISNLLFSEEYESLIIPLFKFNKFYEEETKLFKKPTIENINHNNNLTSTQKDDKKMKRRKWLTEEISNSFSSEQSNNELENKDLRFDPVNQKNKIKKMMNIKDNYYTVKLNNNKNPLYKAYDQMKIDLKFKQLNNNNSAKNLITI